MTQKPQLLSRTHIGSRSDLIQAIRDLPKDVEGLEEVYVMNVYHDEKSNEKWLEIQPAE